MNTTLYQMQRDLRDIYLDLQKFVQYYNLGVQTDAHDPSLFGASGAQILVATFEQNAMLEADDFLFF